MKKILVVFAVVAAAVLLAQSAALCREGQTLNLTKYKTKASLDLHKGKICRIVLKGKINHFGNPDYHATVTGVNVWIAEYPWSKKLKVESGETGWWVLNIIKYKGTDLEFSFIYEKPGWLTTKSNVITVTDEDNVDIAIQFIDPVYFDKGMKPLVEQILSANTPAGGSVSFRNAVVATVGKSWASMHDDRLPHGLAGATVTAIPGAAGPIYFDESVRPNPAYNATSKDGGVAWLNVPRGTHKVTASMQGAGFETVKFKIDRTDARTGIVLYIASPPDSIQSTDNSNP
jgi:hypothetical protein